MLRFLVFIIVVLPGIAIFSQDNVQELALLPTEIRESSGLIHYNGKLITHNDSGNTPQLFVIDTISLELQRTVTISNAVNIDWEAITQDEDFIYIGDFGNNLGSRQDLRILKVSKLDFLASDTVDAAVIEFTYEDQTDFSPSDTSDWDAEAFFFFQGHLIILTKQRQHNGTVAYRVPNIPGTYSAERLDSYQVNGLVTDATYASENNTLYLIGYSQFLVPFFAVVEAVANDTIFGGHKTKSLLNMGFAQIEGVTAVGGSFYLSSEAFTNVSPQIVSDSRLFRFSLNEHSIFEDSPENDNTPASDSNTVNRLVLYRSFGSDTLNYMLDTDEPIFGMGIFDPIGRLVSFTPLENINGNSVDLSGLDTGVYHLAFFLGSGIIVKSFIVD
ncbi:MAG: T9SS type A sorting domain-containing protein [Bacteroidota bacterium]